MGREHYCVEILDEGGRKLVLSYFLVQEDAQSNSFSRELWGVGVRLERDAFVEEKVLRDISSRKENVEGLLYELRCGEVTPCTLDDIVYDVLSR